MTEPKPLVSKLDSSSNEQTKGPQEKQTLEKSPVSMHLPFVTVCIFVHTNSLGEGNAVINNWSLSEQHEFSCSALKQNEF